MLGRPSLRVFLPVGVTESKFLKDWREQEPISYVVDPNTPSEA